MNYRFTFQFETGRMLFSLIGRYDLFEDRFDVGIEGHFLIRSIQDETLIEIRGEPDIE